MKWLRGDMSDEDWEDFKGWMVSGIVCLILVVMAYLVLEGRG